MQLLFKFPARSRPEKFIQAIINITDNIRTDNYRILVSLDIDDKTMTTPGIKDFIKANPKINAVWGTSEGKIHAVNRDIWLEENWDILLVHSDDMIFTKKYFDDDIIEAFQGFDGLVHFPDGHVNERLITYPMMHREYYKKFNYVYHPGYWSVYADNEQHQVAITLGKYKYVDKHILVHAHSIWGHGAPDALLKRNEEPGAYKKDGFLFTQRQAANFDL